VRCRIVSAVFLGVWFVLLAGDFSDDLGLFDDDGAVDQALDVALADFGQAIDISDHSNAAAWLAASDHVPAAPAALPPASLFTNETSPAAPFRASTAPELALYVRERSTVFLL